MSEYDIKVDSKNTGCLKFSRKFRALLYFGLFLTSIPAYVGIGHINRGIHERDWITVGVNSFAQECLFYLCMMVFFFMLVVIAVTKKPFSNVLVVGVYVLGITFLLCGIFFPQIKGYEPSGYYFLKMGALFYIDGMWFATGIAVLVFGTVLKYGFAYQKEMDMIV